MTYAQARLRLGISSVGILVVLSLVGLLTGIASSTLPTVPLDPMREAGWIAAAFSVFVIVSAAFDLFGGWLLPRRFGRSVTSFASFCRRWAVGVFVQGTWTVILGLTVLAVARPWGTTAAILVMTIAIGLLIVSQSWFARCVGGLRLRRMTGSEPNSWPFDDVFPAERVLWVEHDDPGFTGGWTGLPGREKLVLPMGWARDLEREELETALQRRFAVLQSGARWRGVTVAALFNLAGLLVVLGLPEAGLTSVAGLAATAMGFTLWSFVGALLLPTLSRPAVYAADAIARSRGVPEPVLARTIRELDRLQDDEPSRSPLVETIFHPIPSVRNRARALASPRHPHPGAWHAARLALWTSWACFGLLGRAVHCNCGRPELWVLLPTD